MSLDMLEQNAKTFLEAVYEYERKLGAGDKKGAEQLKAYMKALLGSSKKMLEQERKSWT